MKIFDETKTKELTQDECDMTKGYFSEETVVKGTRPSLIETLKNADGSESVTKYDSLEIKENILVYKLFTAKDNYTREKDLLEKWFETEYREQFEKCSRKIAMGIVMKDGTDPKIKLNELYSQAETNAKRINELKMMIEQL